MPHGGTLTIETQAVVLGEHDSQRPSELAPGHYVCLSVSDTGVGMEKTTQSRMFEPFFTTKEVGRGTGLGLSMVLGIVQQSGGGVAVRSALGQGTRVNIYLPCSDRPAQFAPSTLPPVQPLPGGSETILLVEDDNSVRTLACSVLRRHGYRVLE